METLGKARFLGTFTFARARTVGTTENGEEVVTVVETIVGEFERSGPLWQSCEFELRSEEVMDGIVENFSGESLWIVA